MTQADKYFAKDGRYTDRVIDLVMELKANPRENYGKILHKFMDNTKLHLAGMKLVESDMKYTYFCTSEHILEMIKKITMKEQE